MKGVEVIDSIRLVNGQSYQSYCQQWMNWVVGINPETNNYGTVCFLHGVAPREKQDDENYSNKPVIRIESPGNRDQCGRTYLLSYNRSILLII